MSNKKDRRVTIYDIAKEIGIAPSSVSKALNDEPNISDKIKALVRMKVAELNYVHNSSAANLRRGSSRTIGVIVPKINTAFFSDAIAGMEEACAENDHNLIICQSGESYLKEVRAVKTLLRQNVDCIIISISKETRQTTHLQEIANHHVNLIQFDRVDHSIESHTIVNDNEKAAYKSVKHLIDKGYRRIALLGGPEYLSIYKDRKEGYLKAIREADLTIPYNYVVENALTTERGMEVATELLNSSHPPDAFFTLSDYSALGVLRITHSMALQVPEQIGIMGFANEPFTDLITPGLSSVDQKSRQMGKDAVNVYFNHILKQPAGAKFRKLVIESSLVIRESSLKKKAKKRAVAVVSSQG